MHWVGKQHARWKECRPCHCCRLRRCRDHQCPQHMAWLRQQFVDRVRGLEDCERHRITLCHFMLRLPTLSCRGTMRIPPLQRQQDRKCFSRASPNIMVRTHMCDYNDTQQQGIVVIPDRVDTHRTPPIHPLCAALCSLPSLHRPPHARNAPVLSSPQVTLSKVDLSFVFGSCSGCCHSGGSQF